VPVLDGHVALPDLSDAPQLAGSNFELEPSANIKVDSLNPASLDFARAPATQFFPASSTPSLIVTGFYRELVPANNGVYFYIYWIAQQTRQPLTIEFRQLQNTQSPLDVRLVFNPLLNIVVMDLWTCFPVGSANCSYTSPSGSSWNMAPNIAYFSYNTQTIPGSETSLVTSPTAPSWFMTQQSNWARNGIPALTYGKGGIDLRQLPCYASQDCADWSFIAITPAGSSSPLAIVPFTNGYCSHIDIVKSNPAGTQPLAGALFGLYRPLGDPSSYQRGLLVGSCITDSQGKCSIKSDIGTRLLFEDSAPAGFLPINPMIVNIPSNGFMVSYALRDRSGVVTTGLKIQKISNETGALITGASFLIRQQLANGSYITWSITNASSTFCTDFPPTQTNITSFMLDANGCTTVDIIETSAPIGFVPISLTNVTWCVSSDANKQNCTYRGVLQIKDSPTPNINLTKLGASGVPITGTVLGLSTSGDPNQDYGAVPSYARCTIAAGQTSCKIRAPTLGRYWVVEITPPPLYNRVAPLGPYDIVAGGTYSITVQDVLTPYGAPTAQRLDCYGTPIDMAGSVYQVTSGGNSASFSGTSGFWRTCFDNGTNIFPLDSNGCANFTITETRPPTGQEPATPITQTVYYCGNSRTVPDCGERPIDVTFNSPACTGTVVVQKKLVIVVRELVQYH
jgi:hypothetical protein